MPDVTANYGMPFDFIAFLGISELLYLHQTSIDYIIKLINTFWYIYMPDVTAGYAKLSD